MREPKQSLGTIVPAFAILFLAVFFAGPMKAQRMINPVNTEYLLDSTATGVTTISNDMFDCPVVGGKLMAAAYDSAGYVCIRVWHSSLGTAKSPIALPGTDPDLVIMDDIQLPGKRNFVVVGCTKNGKVEFRRYIVYLANTTFSIDSLPAIPFTSPASGAHPRLDVFPDTLVTINGYPSYSEFVLSYVENGDSLVAYKGPIRFSSAGPARFAIQKLDTTNTEPDVAVATNISNGRKLGFFAYTTATGLYCKEVNFSTKTLSTPVLLSSNPNIHKKPRIEAMNYYDPSVTAVKWQVVSSEYNTSKAVWDINAYNNLSTFNCSSPIGSMNTPYTPAVCAGMGTLGSGFFTGNKNYILGWRQDNTNNMYANYVNVATGKRASSVDTVWYNDTTYYMDTVVLYDTLKFVNTSYITNTNTHYIIDTSYIYLADTSYTYITDTSYTYVTDTTYTNSNSGPGNNGNGNAYGHNKGKAKGNANGHNQGSGSGSVMVVDTTDIITVIDTTNTITLIDTTDIITVIDTTDIFDIIDTLDIVYTDSISILSRDSVFQAMTITLKYRMADLIHFYQVNNTKCGINIPMSVSSATNTGNGVFSVWYDGKKLKYKVVSNTSGFKGEGNNDIIEEGPFGKSIRSVSHPANEAIKLYPNPAHDYVTVEGTNMKSAVVTDMTGRTMLKADLQSNRLDISSLVEGVYMIQFMNDNGVSIQPMRIVKY